MWEDEKFFTTNFKEKKKKKTQTKEVNLIDFFGWILLLKKKGWILRTKKLKEKYSYNKMQNQKQN